MTTPATDPDVCAYLAAGDVVDWDHHSVRKLARELVRPEECDLERIRLLFEWVRDRISHSVDAGREEVTCTASEVLALGTGLCYAKAHLLAALLRAAGLPAGFCYQGFVDPPHTLPGHRTLHGLVGVLLPGRNHWLRLDPRGNTPSLNVQFTPPEDALAYPELEFIDNRIYAQPLPCVVEALRLHQRMDTLLADLPCILVSE